MNGMLLPSVKRSKNLKVIIVANSFLTFFMVLGFYPEPCAS
jgi:hypothetical protein